MFCLTIKNDKIEHSLCRVGTSLVPRPSYHGVPVRGPGNNSRRMRLTKTAPN